MNDTCSTYPDCPKCGQKAKMTKTQYGKRFGCCGLWCWSKKGPLVDAETHQLRQKGHRMIDPIWKTRMMSRGAVYKELAKRLNVSTDVCHFKTMTKPLINRAVDEAMRLRDEQYQKHKS
jgi:hypothetical protein